MATLPPWVVRILTVALRSWVDEESDNGRVENPGKVEDAAAYFGVSIGDIRSAVELTNGVLEIEDGRIVVAG